VKNCFQGNIGGRKKKVVSSQLIPMSVSACSLINSSIRSGWHVHILDAKKKREMHPLGIAAVGWGQKNGRGLRGWGGAKRCRKICRGEHEKCTAGKRCQREELILNDHKSKKLRQLTARRMPYSSRNARM